jgi:hypothetical protein
MIELSEPMLKSRKARMTSGNGEAWFYISPNGLEVEVSDVPRSVSAHSFTISVAQLRRALEVIEGWGVSGGSKWEK